MEALMTHRGSDRVTREELGLVPVPPATETHKPIPHINVVNALIETLAFRHISVVRDEYAVSPDAMKFFGVLEIETQFEGCRFLIAVRNANDKSMRLGLTVGFRVFCCDNMAFHGDFTPVLHKHTKNFNLEDSLAIGVDRMQRNFEPMRNQVTNWKAATISDDAAKVIIYRAFVEDELEAPKHLAPYVHRHYFQPETPEFASRSMWSLQNAFTSAFKVLDAVPQFKATASLGEFFQSSGVHP
jgi:hypothetical protein